MKLNFFIFLGLIKKVLPLNKKTSRIVVGNYRKPLFSYYLLVTPLAVFAASTPWAIMENIFQNLN